LKKPNTGLRATWLGHSTVLIEIDGLRVLTDPVWGTRASPSRLIGPKRFQPVPISLRSLPPVDVIVVSHDHYDHLDYPTIHELAKVDVPFVTSLGVGAHLEAWGVPPKRIVELDWWESHTLPIFQSRQGLPSISRAAGSRIATRRSGRR
jgi:L-ascorbate metabolism protein UlaG (beta-lactamase superfamily)